MKRWLALALIAMFVAGCNSPQSTVDQIRSEIEAFKAVPSDSAQTKIEVDLTKLEIQIQELDEKGKSVEAAAYRSTAENLRADYRAARMVNAVKNTQTTIEGLGHAFKEAGKSVADAFREPETPTPTPKKP